MILRSEVIPLRGRLSAAGQRSEAKVKGQRFFFWPLLLVFFSLPLTFCLGEPISSTELINNAKSFDGQTVTFTGEVIGDVMKRADFVWININDGKNALGIWAPASWGKEITFTGAYKSIGDRVEVTGIFHRACPEHGGDLDIHGVTLQKISTGYKVEEKIDANKINAAIIISGLLGLLWIFRRSRRR